MASPKLAPAARILLGAACVAMAGLFALRYYQAQETRQLAQEALALKQTIEPLTEPRIDSPDLSDYEALLRAEIFGEIPKEEVQRPQLSGILGEYAILNGRAVRQGQDIDGWKVDRIDVNEVRVTMGDRSESLRMFQKGDFQIDNRKNKEEQPPKKFSILPAEGGAPSAPEDAETWRGRFERLRDLENAGQGSRPGSAGSGALGRPGAARGAAGANSAAGRMQGLNMEALRNATPEQIETFLRNRKGGQIDEEKIQELIRRFQAGEFNP